MSKDKLIKHITTRYPLLRAYYLDDVDDSSQSVSADSLDGMMQEDDSSILAVEDETLVYALQQHEESILEIINTALGVLYQARPAVSDFWSFFTVISQGTNAIKIAEIILFLPQTYVCTKVEHKEMLEVLRNTRSSQFIDYLLKILKTSQIREAFTKTNAWVLALKALARAVQLHDTKMEDVTTLRILAGVTNGRITNTDVMAFTFEILPKAYMSPSNDVIQTAGRVTRVGMTTPKAKAWHLFFGVAEALDKAARLVLELETSRQRDLTTQEILGYLPKDIEKDASLLPPSYEYGHFTAEDFINNAEYSERERTKIARISHWEDRCPDTYVFPDTEVLEGYKLSPTEVVRTPILKTFDYHQRPTKSILKPQSKGESAVCRAPCLEPAVPEFSLPIILEALDRLILRDATSDLTVTTASFDEAHIEYESTLTYKIGRCFSGFDDESDCEYKYIEARAKRQRLS